MSAHAYDDDAIDSTVADAEGSQAGRAETRSSETGRCAVKDVPTSCTPSRYAKSSVLLIWRTASSGDCCSVPSWSSTASYGVAAVCSAKGALGEAQHADSWGAYLTVVTAPITC